MNKKGNYEDCLKFIKDVLNINLLDFQKEIIRGYFENRLVVTGRGTGRTMCRSAYGKYIESLMIDEEHAEEAFKEEQFLNMINTYHQHGDVYDITTGKKIGNCSIIKRI